MHHTMCLFTFPAFAGRSLSGGIAQAELTWVPGSAPSYGLPVLKRSPIQALTGTVATLIGTDALPLSQADSILITRNTSLGFLTVM